MKPFNFIPDWNRSPDRATALGYFPASPGGTVREATFSETIAGILGAEPEHDLEELHSSFTSQQSIDDDDIGSELWDAFSSTYVTTGEKGARGSSGNKYIIPFHHSVIRRIKIDEGRNWYRWYWMLMTDEAEDFDQTLHSEFVDQLTDEEPSNLLEDFAISAAEDLDEQVDKNQNKDSADPLAIPPLFPSLAEAFRDDLRTWLEIRDDESLSRWMQGLRDIVCFHYMTYFIQISRSLQAEYAAIENQLQNKERHEVECEHKVQPVFYGLAEEQASSGTRRFATEWSEGKIERAIYDSWGRLVVQRNILEEAADDSTKTPAGAYTLTDAVNTFDEESKKRIVDALMKEFPEDQRDQVPEDLPLWKMAIRFVETVRRYYTNMGQTESSQTAHTLGYNAVEQLGKGIDREFIESRRGVGKISRLDRPGVRLFARLFEQYSADGHIDGLWRYLRRRGIKLDHQSKQAMVRQLESMGMIEKRSDGEEAIYVQTI
jgi:DNA phosphorothioation-dependent restriction protein DptG